MMVDKDRYKAVVAVSTDMTQHAQINQINTRSQIAKSVQACLWLDVPRSNLCQFRSVICEILSSRCLVAQVFDLLGCCAASLGSLLPTFRESVSARNVGNERPTDAAQCPRELDTAIKRKF